MVIIFSNTQAITRNHNNYHYVYQVTTTISGIDVYLTKRPASAFVISRLVAIRIPSMFISFPFHRHKNQTLAYFVALLTFLLLSEAGCQTASHFTTTPVTLTHKSRNDRIEANRRHRGNLQMK